MLLRELRKTVKPLIWVVAAGFVASLFFTYTRISSQEERNILVKINGKKITYSEFINAYRDAYNRYVENTGEQVPPEMENYLKSQILSQLVSNELLYQEAKKAGIKVSQEEVKEQVREIINSFGSRENFMRYLRYRRINYSDFEERVSRQIAISKLTRFLRNSVIVTQQEVKDYWVLKNETLGLTYLFLNPEKYAADIKVDTDEAKNYYQKNKQEFKIPEKVKMEYILVSPDEFKKEVKVTEEELRDYYQEHSEEFKVEEKRKVSHILIRIPQDAGEKAKNEARAKLQQIKQKLDEGASFAELAREYSDDKVSAKEGGDLGYFTYDTMTPEFSKAAFSLKKVGDISDIVETPYGLHLIKLTGIKPAHQKSFEEVKEDIEKNLLEKRKDNLAYQEIKKAKEKIEEGKLSFEEYAKKYPGRVKTTPLFARYEKVDDLAWNTQFNKTAFSLEAGQISSPLRIPEGWCIMTLKEKKPSHIPDWEEARKKAIEKLAQEKAEKITAQRAEDIVNRVKKGKQSLASFAKEWEYNTLNSITRESQIKGIYGEDKREFLKVAFSLTPGKISDPFSLSNGYYIVKVLDRNIPWEKFDKQKKDFRQQILAMKKEEFFTSWFSKVQEEAKIIDNTSSLFASPS